MSVLSKMHSDPLMRHNAIFFAGSFMVAVLNYVYHPILSRMLDVEQFGEVVVFFSLTAQIGVLLGVFNMVAVHLSSNEEHRNGRNVLPDVYAVVFWLQVLLLAALIVFSPFLKTTLQFSSPLPFLLLAFNSFIALPYALTTASLQGKKQFATLSKGSLIQAGGKIIFAVLLVLLGGGVLGALGGLLAAQLVALYYFSGKSLHAITPFPKQLPKFDAALRAELAYAMLVFVATSTIAILYTADTVVMKYFFPPDVAGEYAGISVIARILYFATASISAVLLPSVILAQGHHENFRILKKSASLILLIGGAGMLLMAVFPELIVRILLGAKYLPFAGMLPNVALLMFLTSCINLLFIYLLALRRYVLIPIAVGGIMILTFAVFSMHDSVGAIVRHFLLVDAAVLVSLMVYLGYEYFTNKKTSVDHHSPL